MHGNWLPVKQKVVQYRSTALGCVVLLGITLSALRRNRHIFPSFQAISMMNTTLLFMRKIVYLCDPNMLQSGLITSRVPRQAVVNMACTRLPYQSGKSAMHFRVLQYSIRWQSPCLKQLGIFHSVTLISLQWNESSNKLLKDIGVLPMHILVCK